MPCWAGERPVMRLVHAARFDTGVEKLKLARTLDETHSFKKGREPSSIRASRVDAAAPTRPTKTTRDSIGVQCSPLVRLRENRNESSLLNDAVNAARGVLRFFLDGRSFHMQVAIHANGFARPLLQFGIA